MPKHDPDEIATTTPYLAIIDEINKGTGFLVEEEGFSYPQWTDISKAIKEKSANLDPNVVWHKISIWWLEKLYKRLGSKFYVKQSPNFLILSAQPEEFTEELSEFLEKTLNSILQVYKGVAADIGYGKRVVLIFESQDQYYRYVSHFYKREGVYGKSSGVFLSEGYGHFAFPTQDIRASESIVAHELTHACVSHLSLPHWLNEALAVSLEKYMTGSNSLYGDLATMQDVKKLWDDQRQFWRRVSIQDFWSGESFHRADEGQKYSYILADSLFKNICESYKSFKELAVCSTIYDAGNEISKVMFEHGLGTEVSFMLGEGDWEPSIEQLVGPKDRAKQGN